MTFRHRRLDSFQRSFQGSGAAGGIYRDDVRMRRGRTPTVKHALGNVSGKDGDQRDARRRGYVLAG